MSAPLLRSVGARITGDGPLLGDFEADGARLILVGDWTWLFELLLGRRRLADGQLELAGAPAEGAAARGAAGLLLHELPATWTLRDVLIESAALLGDGPWRASRRARALIEELELGPHARKRLARLGAVQKRATGIACALLGEPPVLVLDDPFRGLEPSAQAELGPLLERALAGRRALIGIPAVPGSPSEDALAASSEELLFLSQRRLVARTKFRDLGARARSYRVSVKRSVDGLLSRLAEAGYEVRRMLTADVTTLLVIDPGGLGTLPLFGAALAAGAPIVELVPAGPVGVPAARDAAEA